MRGLVWHVVFGGACEKHQRAMKPRGEQWGCRIVRQTHELYDKRGAARQVLGGLATLTRRGARCRKQALDTPAPGQAYQT